MIIPQVEHGSYLPEYILMKWTDLQSLITSATFDRLLLWFWEHLTHTLAHFSSWKLPQGRLEPYKVVEFSIFVLPSPALRFQHSHCEPIFEVSRCVFSALFNLINWSLQLFGNILRDSLEINSYQEKSIRVSLHWICEIFGEFFTSVSHFDFHWRKFAFCSSSTRHFSMKTHLRESLTRCPPGYLIKPENYRIFHSPSESAITGSFLVT